MVFTDEAVYDSGQISSLDRIDALTRSMTQKISAIGVVGMLFVGMATLVDVLIFRTVFNQPIAGFNELLQTVFAVAIASVLAGGLADRSALRVDILHRMLGVRLARWLGVTGEVLTLAFFGMLTVACYQRASLTLMFNGQTTVLSLPTGPFMMAIAGFIAICVPVQLVVTLVSIRDAARAERPDGGWFGALAFVAAASAIFCGLTWWAIPVLGPALASDPTSLAIVGFLSLWVLVLITIPVGVSMALVGIIGSALFMGWGRSTSVLGTETTGLLMNGELALIPLFLMMGAFATAAGLAADIYRLAQAAIGWTRGGIAMATIGSCAGFGALTGSSMATVATIGSVSVPEMSKRGYASSLSAGSVAAGATLGQLIPPSTVIVLYALLVEESIGKLYMAALGPAILTIVLYLTVIAMAVRLKPGIAPGSGTFRMGELMTGLGRAWVVILIFGAVIGGIYSGVFTATEAASVGSVATFAVCLFRGKLKGRAFWTVAAETTSAISMVYPLIIGALILTFFLDLSELPRVVVDAVVGLPIPKLATLLLLICAFVILGAVMDSVAVMIMTAAIVTPIVVSLGFDPIWWGIMMLIVVELGVVTPPFGLNLFMLKSVAPDITSRTVYRGVMPFVFADLLKITLLISFPAIALWLPGTMS